jgi:hypothetical protein
MVEACLFEVVVEKERERSRPDKITRSGEAEELRTDPEVLRCCRKPEGVGVGGEGRGGRG